MTLREFLLGGPRFEPGTPWKAGWAIAVAVVILVVSQLVAVAFVPWLAAGLLVPSPVSPIGLPSTEVADGATFLLLLLTTQVIAVALVLLFSYLFGGRPVSVLKLYAIDGGAMTIVYALVMMAVLLGAANSVFYWLLKSDVLSDMHQYLVLVRAEPWLLSVLTIGVGAPLMEELLFRGFLLSALARGRLGFWLAAVLATAAWTALHWGYSAIGLFEVFLVGLYFSWLLWRTGSLWPAIICHAVYNTGLVLVLRLVPLPV